MSTLYGNQFFVHFLFKLKQIHIDKGMTAGYSTNIPLCLTLSDINDDFPLNKYSHRIMRSRGGCVYCSFYEA